MFSIILGHDSLAMEHTDRNYSMLGLFDCTDVTIKCDCALVGARQMQDQCDCSLKSTKPISPPPENPIQTIPHDVPSIMKFTKLLRKPSRNRLGLSECLSWCGGIAFAHEQNGNGITYRNGFVDRHLECCLPGLCYHVSGDRCRLRYCSRVF